MIRALVFAVLGLVVCYAVWLIVLWRFQERVVFQPPSGGGAAHVSARQVRYRALDGVQLFAYVVGDCTAASVVVISFHGNADLARRLVPWAKSAAAETNACVVLPEYRGYDGLPERSTYATSAYDARAALDYVRTQLGASPENIVYFGHSLGTAIATELASVALPRALVLQSPFSSARAMAKRMVVPGLLAFWDVISRVHFNTVDRVRELNCPVWVTHGDRDPVVPIRMGREVFAAARNKGELLIVPGAAHSDVAELGGRAYWGWFRRALSPAATSPSDPGARAETPPAL
jgi:pimeloyl-ACP methyl ester carboxylesterase